MDQPLQVFCPSDGQLATAKTKLHSETVSINSPFSCSASVIDIADQPLHFSAKLASDSCYLKPQAALPTEFFYGLESVCYSVVHIKRGRKKL